MLNKVTTRSYGFFFKFSYFFCCGNGFLQQCLKLQKLVKKTQGILGVKEGITLLDESVKKNP
jgi:hypothetical protein